MQKAGIRIILSITVLSFLTFVRTDKVVAQLLENNLSIYVSWSSGRHWGDEYVNRNGLVTPSLFPNFMHAEGFQLSGSYKLNSWIAPGLHFGFGYSDVWEHSKSLLYLNATATSYFIAPAIKLYTPVKELGFFNRFSVFGEFAPGVHWANIQYAYPVMQIENGGADEMPLSESFRDWGLRAAISARYDISYWFGIHMGLSTHRKFTNGAFFLDKSYASAQLEMGIYFRLLMNKRLYR